MHSCFLIYIFHDGGGDDDGILFAEFVKEEEAGTPKVSFGKLGHINERWFKVNLAAMQEFCIV